MDFLRKKNPKVSLHQYRVFSTVKEKSSSRSERGRAKITSRYFEVNFREIGVFRSQKAVFCLEIIAVRSLAIAKIGFVAG
jgi:hypothetical protein